MLLSFISFTSLHFAKLVNAAWISMRCTPDSLPFVHSAYVQFTMMATASTADQSFLLLMFHRSVVLRIPPLLLAVPQLLSQWPLPCSWAVRLCNTLLASYSCPCWVCETQLLWLASRQLDAILGELLLCLAYYPFCITVPEKVNGSKGQWTVCPGLVPSWQIVSIGPAWLHFR